MRLRILWRLLASLFAIVALSSCGGNDTEEASTGTAVPPSAAETVSPTTSEETGTTSDGSNDESTAETSDQTEPSPTTSEGSALSPTPIPDDGIGALSGRLAFTTEVLPPWQLHIVNADGSDLTPITDETMNVLQPVWFPDGSRLLILVVHGSQIPIGLYMIDADGSNLTLLREFSRIEGEPIRVSPDGTKILFSSPTDDFGGIGKSIFVLDLQSSEETMLIPYGEQDENGEVIDWRAEMPSWSPDGQSIVFIRRAQYGGDVMIMNADGSNMRQISESPTENFEPRWSPDGSSILFSRLTGDGNNITDLYISSPDGSNLTNITNSPAIYQFHSWSPDGNAISFTRESHIYVVNKDGSDLRQVTSVPSAASAVWSPDGQYIAFSSRRSSETEFDIYVVSADGTFEAIVSDQTQHEGNPAWDPSSQ